jgi:protein subunit release factor B
LMYVAWAESKGATVRTVDTFSFGGWTEAHIEIDLVESFGWLREETGTHILYSPGISRPFSATVEVWPSSTERDRESQQNPNIRISSYYGSSPRSSLRRAVVAATSEGVRMTVEDERSSRAEVRARRWVQAELSAGSREKRWEKSALKRRTYSLHEEKLYVRDHLTGLEDEDPSAVLKGKLAPFIRASRLGSITPMHDVYNGFFVHEGRQ